MRNRCPGCVDEEATEAGRGGQKSVWNAEMIIERGYGIAMFHYGDVDPDKNRPEDWSDGVHPNFMKPGQKKPGRHDWGAIAAWDYGIHRAVDYMVGDPAIDGNKLPVSATRGWARQHCWPQPWMIRLPWRFLTRPDVAARRQTAITLENQLNGSIPCFLTGSMIHSRSSTPGSSGCRSISTVCLHCVHRDLC